MFLSRSALVVGLAFLIAGCGRTPVPATGDIVGSASPSTTAGVKPPAVAPEDWPGWRGPKTDGLAPDAVAPTDWQDPANLVWKSRIPGRGHGSPIVIGDQIYLETADEAAEVQSVLAVDRRRGKLLWQTDLHSGNFEPKVHPENTHASSTLASDGERLFAVFLNDRRVWCSALNLDGHELWRTEVGGFRSMHGYSASPAVYESLVIIAGDHEDGGFVAGLDRASGDIVWRRKRPANASWCSPRVVRLGGRDQLILSGCRRVISYDPLTGEELWNVAGTTESTVGSAVVSGNLVIVSGGYPESDTVALKPDGAVAWRIKDKSYVPSLLAVDDVLYMIRDDGVLLCLQADTGKERWKRRIGGNFRTSPLLCLGNIFLTDMAGKTTVFAANPEKFELIAENQLGTEAFASPAVSEDQLILRVADSSRGTRQEWLYCIGAK